MKKSAVLTSLGLSILLVVGLFVWRPFGVPAGVTLSPQVKAASAEAEESDLVLPLPGTASRVVEATGAAGVEADAAAASSAAQGSPAKAASKALTKAKTGTLVVCIDGADAEGAIVTLQGGTGLFMGGDVVPERSQSHAVESAGYQMGRALIEDIRLSTWSIEVVEASGRMNRTYVSLNAAEPHQEVTLAFGDAVFEGTVWQEDGQPWEEFLVAVDIEPNEAPPRSLSPGVLAVPVKRPWRTWRRTDADGRYRVDGMIPGTGWYVFSAPGPLVSSPGDSRRRLAKPYGVKEGQQFIVNYGSPLGTAKLKLSVRDGTGRDVRSGGVELIARDEPAVAPGSVRYNVNPLNRDIAESGIAKFDLAPGTYGVHLRRIDGDYGVVGDIEVRAPGEVALSIDLPPAHAIHGSAVGSDGLPREGAFLLAEIGLRREPTGRVLSRTSLLTDGTFAFHTVENGEYYVTMGEGEELSSTPISITGTSPTAFEVTLFGN